MSMDILTMEEGQTVEVVLPTDETTSERQDERQTTQSVSAVKLEPSNRFGEFRKAMFQLCVKNEFVILIVLDMVLARIYPPLGAKYLYPQITASWIAITFIFVMAGMGIKTEEFKNAVQQLKFNIFVQVFNFGVVSGIVYGVSRALELANLISEDLADGMVIASCMTMTLNTVVVFTKAAKGDEATAIFNTAFGSMVGIFLSPALILGYLGVSADVDLVSTFVKLALKVIFPLAVGQLLRFIPSIVNFCSKNQSLLKKLQTYCVVYIVYTIFCKTFANGTDSSLKDIAVMILFLLLLFAMLTRLSWFLLRLFFPDQPELCVMGLFGCTQKTLGLGIPLLNAMYENHPKLGLYTLPLLVWYQMELVLGSFFIPRLAKFVDDERERLGCRIVNYETAAVTTKKAATSNSEKAAADDGNYPRREMQQSTDSLDCTEKVYGSSDLNHD